MKTFLALAAVLAVSVSAAGGASALDDNLFGLYYDQAATIDEINISPNSQQVLYLVLINPVSAYGGVQMVGGFECSIQPASGDFLLGVTFPLDAINVNGSADNLMVGYNNPGLRVSSGNGTTLATLTVLTMGNNPEGYLLQPASPASYPNTMGYLAMGSETLHVYAKPTSGSYDQPVFTFGEYTVKEDRKWGDVKSLYR